MNKQDIYDFLKKREIWYEITEHEKIHTMKEAENISLPYPDAVVKNLFIKDEKRQNYYLISVKKDKRPDLKEFRKKNQTARLTFATEQELKEILICTLSFLGRAIIIFLHDLNDMFCLYILN